MYSTGRFFFAPAIAVLFLLSPALTSTSGAEEKRVTIRADRGGTLIHYAIRAKKLEKQGSRVRFSGPCDSACTLYLGIPQSSMCISAGASFGFHLPYGVSARGNTAAAKYMLRSYPGWVRRWIEQKGGLGRNIKRMPYAYARNYIRSCGEV
jgi:hypothetical protein